MHGFSHFYERQYEGWDKIDNAFEWLDRGLYLLGFLDICGLKKVAPKTSKKSKCGVEDPLNL